jgi:hypothetical protein
MQSKQRVAAAANGEDGVRMDTGGQNSVDVNSDI